MSDQRDDTYQPGLVSLCCLGYNHAAYIQECIESIWRQDYTNIEIIALDDGSSDNSKEILQHLKQISPFPMTLILQENSGNIARNLNRLLQNAKGEYVSLISMDDTLTSDTLTSQLDVFMNCDHLVFAGYTHYNLIDSHGRRVRTKALFKRHSAIPHTADELLETEYDNLGIILLQGVLIRRVILDQVGGYDEDLLGDDIILRTKLFLHMKKIPHLRFVMLDRVGCNYRVHDENIHKDSMRQLRVLMQWKERYYPERKCPNKLIKRIREAYYDNSAVFNYSNMEELYYMLDHLLRTDHGTVRREQLADMLVPPMIEQRRIAYVIKYTRMRTPTHLKSVFELFGFTLFTKAKALR